MLYQKPYSESCDQNKYPILDVLKKFLLDAKDVLEIGSGTGQHAVFFGKQFPAITWQTSDLQENHDGIMAWLDEAKLPNVLPPLILDAQRQSWPIEKYFDVVFTANTFHIMSWDAVISAMVGIGSVLKTNGLFIVYGPFNYDGQFTSDSNQRFDIWLKSRDSLSGIRDVTDLKREGARVNLELVYDIAMPVNNRILVWKKVVSSQ